MILVGLAVIAFFAIIVSALAIPAIAGAIKQAQLIHSVSGMRQIYLATFAISLDNEKKELPAIWPSASGTSSNVTAFFNQLDLAGGDIERILSAPGIKVNVEGQRGAWAIHCNPNPAYRFYAVGDRPDDGMQVFMSSFNVQCAPGSITVDKNAVPFGNFGGAICRKSGSAEAFQTRVLRRQAIQDTIPKDQAEELPWK